jgi:hypothetical protein
VVSISESHWQAHHFTGKGLENFESTSNSGWHHHEGRAQAANIIES